MGGCLVWQGRGRGPGPGELDVLGAGGETELGRCVGASRAAGRVPRAERGFEPMTRWSKREKYLQFLQNGGK